MYFKHSSVGLTLIPERYFRAFSNLVLQPVPAKNIISEWRINKFCSISADQMMESTSTGTGDQPVIMPEKQWVSQSFMG